MAVMEIIGSGLRKCPCCGQDIIDDLPSVKIFRDRGNPLYTIYRNIKDRCYNAKNKRYPDYGGKGVKMCDEWFNDFDKFNAWAVKNGWKPKLQIDRIDNALGYGPDNCRFVTLRENNRNKSKSFLIEYNGVTKKAYEWAEVIGITYNLVYHRIKILGMPPEIAFTKPKYGKHLKFKERRPRSK